MIDAATRRLVIDRAKSQCEYCRLPQSAYAATFNIDHIVASQHEGSDDAGNLALSCPKCNRKKGPNLAGIDPLTKAIVPLFNPRKDLWTDHLLWNGPLLAGLTPCGRATISVLDLNGESRVELRVALIVLGGFPAEERERSNGMQLYIEGVVEETTLAGEIGNLLQLRVAPVASLDPSAQVVYWFERQHFDRGFLTDIALTWARTVHPRMDDITLALNLSKSFGARVATDVPEGLPESGDPFYWLVADPSGGLNIIGEDMKVEGPFVLDESTSRPFVRTNRHPTDGR